MPGRRVGTLDEDPLVFPIHSFYQGMSIANRFVCDRRSQAGTAELAKMAAV